MNTNLIQEVQDFDDSIATSKPKEQSIIPIFQNIQSAKYLNNKSPHNFFFVFSSSRLSVRLFYYYGSLTSLDFTRLQNTKFLFFGRPFATLAAFRFSETNEFAFFYHFNYQIINMLACARCNKLCGTDVSRTDSSTLRATSRFVSKTKTKCAKIVTLIFIRNPNAHKKYGRSIREYPHLSYAFMRL